MSPPRRPKGECQHLYLVPPCTALLAWLLFDELLTPLVLAGLALAALGVGLVVREPLRPQSLPKEARP